MKLYVVNKITGCGTYSNGIYSTKEKALEKVQLLIDNDWCKYRPSAEEENIWVAVNYDDMWICFYETELDKDC